MAMTINDRKNARESLKIKFDDWKEWNDQELLYELREAMGVDVNWTGREDAIKWLVLTFIDRRML
jgi:alpha-L-arabinofuranosidase